MLNAAKQFMLVMIVALATAGLTGPAFASNDEKVARVVASYKQWVAREGHTVTGRVRIVLRSGKIVVHMPIETGTTKLIYSADGTAFLGRETAQAARASNSRKRCQSIFRCNDANNPDSSDKARLQASISPEQPENDDGNITVAAATPNPSPSPAEPPTSSSDDADDEPIEADEPVEDDEPVETDEPEEDDEPTYVVGQR